jgi:hypothetical protein
MGSGSGVASNGWAVALLGDGEQEHIRIAIESHAVHDLNMTGLFAFEPQFAAGATEVHSALGLGGFFQGLAVHPGHHQHISTARFLGNHRQQALAIKTNLVKPRRWGTVAQGSRKRRES